jgi:hypothetical protein
MPGCQNAQLSKCPVVKMPNCKNGHLSKCPVVKMLSCQNATLSKCPVIKMPNCQNATLTKEPRPNGSALFRFALDTAALLGGNEYLVSQIYADRAKCYKTSLSIIYDFFTKLEYLLKQAGKACQGQTL